MQVIDIDRVLQSDPSRQKHSSQAFAFSAARALERGSYYGVRSLIVLYMINGPLKISEHDANTTYGMLVGSMIVFQIVGSLFGDLIIGNKNAILLGGILQTLGTFVLCVESINALYAGLFFISLGSGLFTPNILANYGKLYRDKPGLMDAGFTLLYLAVMLGAFLGPLIIGQIGSYNFEYGFVMAGLVMALSVIISIVTGKGGPPDNTSEQASSSGNNIFYVVASIIIMGVFWAVYDYAGNGLYLLKEQIQRGVSIPHLRSIDLVFTILIATIASVIWSFYYTTPFMKWVLGFMLAAAGFGVLLRIQETASPQALMVYVLAVFLISVSEVMTSPILYSILTKYSSPKYLAIVIALASVPGAAIYYLPGYSAFGQNAEVHLSLQVAAIVCGLLGLAVLVFLLLKRKSVKESF